MPATFTKFGSVRDVVNAMVSNLNKTDNPVVSVTLVYTFPAERS